MSSAPVDVVVAETRPPAVAPVTLGEAFWVWLRIAALSFGGPAGQIAVMHRILVDEKRWIGEHRFPACAQLLHAAARPGGAAACDLYRLADAPDPRRALSPGTLFVLPGAISIMALSWIYALSAMSASSRHCSSA
jgi:chromate transporter